MVEARLALLQIRRDWLEILQLFLTQNFFDRLHLPERCIGNWQRHPLSVPAVRPGDVVQAASLNCLVVEGNVDCDVLHGLRTCPIRVVLVPTCMYVCMHVCVHA